MQQTGRSQVISFLSVFLVDADENAIAEAADDAAAIGWYSLEEIRVLPVPASVLECAERLAEARVRSSVRARALTM